MTNRICCNKSFDLVVLMASSCRYIHSQIIIEEPTYLLEPSESERFYPSRAKSIALDVLTTEISNAKIDDKFIEDWSEFSDDMEDLGKKVADHIKNRIREEMNIPRYKIVVQVSIGQRKNQGVCITSRCLWNTATDNFASAEFKNEYIWSNALIFGLYTD